MKYRNDFVTNSSSSISLWHKYKIEYDAPEAVKQDLTEEKKLKYQRNVITYSGPNLDCLFSYDEGSLENYLAYSEPELLKYHVIFAELDRPDEIEEFEISDLFIEYLNEVNHGVKIEIKPLKPDDCYSDKFYLWAKFSGVTVWDDNARKNVTGEKIVDFAPEELKEARGESDIYYVDHYVSEFVERFYTVLDNYIYEGGYKKPLSFNLWLAGKYLTCDGFNDGGLTISTEQLTPKPGKKYGHIGNSENDFEVKTSRMKDLYDNAPPTPKKKKKGKKK